jgi:hypothetical protein
LKKEYKNIAREIITRNSGVRI